MPAIDVVPTTVVEARPASQTPAANDNSGATDNRASDAFIAALLAQSVMPPAPAEVPPAAAPVAVAAATGQPLPGVRPAFAAMSPPQRATNGAVVISSDGIVAAPTTLTPATADAEGEDDFAATLASVQDSMSAASRGEQNTTSDAGGDGELRLLTDLFGASHGPGHTPRTEQGLDAMAGLSGLRNGQQAHGSGQTYDLKAAALPIDQPALLAARLNQHISVMLGDQLQSAQIAVSPAELGPVEVRITLVGDEAKIQLVASHASTREALADALPRLRASLADAGLSLAQAGVFAQMPERQPPQAFVAANAGHGDGDLERAPVAALPAARALRIGLIDAFV